MSKKFKRLSAVILAVVMMLGSTVMASAATMHVYIREWEQGTSNGICSNHERLCKKVDTD